MKEAHFKQHPEWRWCSKDRKKSTGGYYDDVASDDDDDDDDDVSDEDDDDDASDEPLQAIRHCLVSLTSRSRQCRHQCFHHCHWSFKVHLFLSQSVHSNSFLHSRHWQCCDSKQLGSFGFDSCLVCRRDLRPRTLCRQSRRKPCRQGQ